MLLTMYCACILNRDAIYIGADDPFLFKECFIQFFVLSSFPFPHVQLD